MATQWILSLKGNLDTSTSCLVWGQFLTAITRKKTIKTFFVSEGHVYWLLSIHDFHFETKFRFYFRLEAKMFVSKRKKCFILSAFLNDLNYASFISLRFVYSRLLKVYFHSYFAYCCLVQNCKGHSTLVMCHVMCEGNGIIFCPLDFAIFVEPFS